MYQSDIKYLCCPKTEEELQFYEIESEDDDGEVIEGTLKSIISGEIYKITNGIPRFIESIEDNKTWNYKWTELDGGKGLNYKIADKSDPAYALHDLFDKNSYDGHSHAKAEGKVALDIGCGVGQYSWRMLNEYKPAKMISTDLTHGTDIFRGIMLQRFPEHKKSLLIVQASIFSPPFKQGSIDYVMSLGVLMHTGDTRLAIKQAANLVAEDGFLNIWIYASIPMAYDCRERGRDKPVTVINVIPEQIRQVIVFTWARLINAVPHDLAVSIMKFFSSEFIYKITNIPVLGKLIEFLIPRVRHPDKEYRLINTYDWFRNNWGDTWNEHEIFPVLKENSIVVLGMSKWRLGFWGKKNVSFYED